jgi:hypothetical protein
MIRVMSAPKAEYPRNLDDDFKLSYRSIAEVYEAFGRIEALVRGDKSIRFKGRIRPKGAAILNAILLYMDALPADQQRRAVADGMARLNEFMRIEQVEGEEPQGEGSRGIVIEPEREEPRGKLKRKGAG